MTISFEEIKTTLDQLWDYGWFSLTRFHVSKSMMNRVPAEVVLDHFIQDSIYRRSFCESPDPWNVEIDRHGPFLIGAIKNEWFHRVTVKELAVLIESILNGEIFDKPPTEEQQRPIENWLNGLHGKGNSLFSLDVREAENVRVDWAFIWPVFREFIAINQAASELTIAVIGYD